MNKFNSDIFFFEVFEIGSEYAFDKFTELLARIPEGMEHLMLRWMLELGFPPTKKELLKELDIMCKFLKILAKDTTRLKKVLGQLDTGQLLRKLSERYQPRRGYFH